MSDRVNRLSPRWQMALAMLTLYIVWGSTYLGIRFAIESIPPFLMASARFLFAGSVLYIWMRLRGVPNPTRLNSRAGLIVGGLLLLGGNGGVTFAEQYVPSSLAAVMVGAIPAWAVLFDWLIYGGQRPTRRVAIGLAGGLLGVALLAGPSNLLGGESFHTLGIVALLIATLTWAIGSLYSRHAPLPRVPLMATGIEMLAGGLWLALAGTLAGEWSQLDVSAITMKSALALAYLAVFGSLLAFTAYVWLLRNTTPARATSYAYVNPIVALFLGATLAGEEISVRTIVAAAIIIGSVVLLTSSRAERKPVEPVKEAAPVRAEVVAESAPCK
ncbi:MAG: drug/metabolite exporter YedA [Chloroflexi bacterium]|nr:drug/metabolite exporter YedA [Chloroflexota bacterium]